MKHANNSIVGREAQVAQDAQGQQAQGGQEAKAWKLRNLFQKHCGRNSAHVLLA